MTSPRDPDSKGAQVVHGKLLLVDDDPPLRRTMARQLEREGFEVVTAASLKEAYEAVAEVLPDFAVVDLNLGDGHGMELINSLLDARQDMRIVVLTGL